MKQVLSNGFWLLFGRCVELGFSLLATGLLSRCLGVENLGMIGGGMALVAIMSPLASVGLRRALTKKIAEVPRDQGTDIVGSGLILSLCFSVATWGVVVAVVYLLLSNGPKVSWVYYCCSILLIFQPRYVFFAWFDGIGRSKLGALVSLYSSIGSSVLKIFLLLWYPNIELFVVGIIIGDGLFPWLIACIQFRRSDTFGPNFRLNRVVLSSIFPEAIYFSIAAIFVMINRSADLLMLNRFGQAEQGGYYAAAAKLSEILYFFTITASTVMYPALARRFRGPLPLDKVALLNVFRVYSMLAWCIIIFGSLVSGTLIRLIYGVGFSSASAIFIVHVWSCIPIFLGNARGQLLTIKGRFAVMCFSAIIGAVANLFGNYFIIPVYGGLGAAYVSLFSYTVGGVLTSFLFKDLSGVGFTQLKAILSPFVRLHWFREFFSDEILQD